MNLSARRTLRDPLGVEGSGYGNAGPAVGYAGPVGFSGPDMCNIFDRPATHKLQSSIKNRYYLSLIHI